MTARQYAHDPKLNTPVRDLTWQDRVRLPDIVDEDDANLVTSLTGDGTHAPLLDIDFEARLVESGTPGHYHLYLDGVELSWWRYAVVLVVLAWAGILQWGYVGWSLYRRYTCVRHGCVKPDDYYKGAGAHTSAIDTSWVGALAASMGHPFERKPFAWRWQREDDRMSDGTPKVRPDAHGGGGY